MCYIAYQKKIRKIYLAFVHGHKLQHKKLLSEGRKQIKVFYLKANSDVDVKSLNEILKESTSYIEGLPEKKKGSKPKA